MATAPPRAPFPLCLLLTVAETDCHHVLIPQAPIPALPINPPTLRQQIVDHINAYVTEVVCIEARQDSYGHFLAVAARSSDSVRRLSNALDTAPCTPWNEIADIRCRAPEVDNARYKVMRERMGKPLYLGNSLQGL
ncbi:MAG: hypothetical protein ACE5JH_01360 [Acidobacteriota bacterium]